jgi:hypothetical protein
VVYSQFTDDFLLALQPEVIYSDQGGNFLGAAPLIAPCLEQIGDDIKFKKEMVWRGI